MVVISFGNFAGKSSEINGQNRKFSPQEFVVRKVVALELSRIFTDSWSHTIFFDEYGPNSVHRHKKIPVQKSFSQISARVFISGGNIKNCYLPPPFPGLCSSSLLISACSCQHQRSQQEYTCPCHRRRVCGICHIFVCPCH